MKAKDVLLDKWAQILAKKPDSPAIFDVARNLARTFRQIDERASNFESEIEKLGAGSVLAVQIGNHEDWPAVLVACLRRGVIVLPLEQSVSDQHRDAALKVCRANGIVEKNGILRKIDNKPPTWDAKAPALLKLTSGTTAEPRAIHFRSEHLLADCDQICETMGIS